MQHGHACLRVQEVGWAGKENGELLALAENKFDVLVTIDTNLRYQQNVTGRRIAIVIIMAKSNRLEHLAQHFPSCAKVLDKINPGMSPTWATRLESFN